jgi:hypothetical protein
MSLLVYSPGQRRKKKARMIIPVMAWYRTSVEAESHASDDLDGNRLDAKGSWIGGFP